MLFGKIPEYDLHESFSAVSFEVPEGLQYFAFKIEVGKNENYFTSKQVLVLSAIDVA